MAGDNFIQIVGNLTTDPELRNTTTGKTVVTINVAENPRFFDANSGEWKDGQPIFMRCSAWGQLGLNALASLKRGEQVIVLGQLQQNRVPQPDGTNRTFTDIRVSYIGPSLQFVQTSATKVVGTVTDPREVSEPVSVHEVAVVPAEAGKKVKVPF